MAKNKDKSSEESMTFMGREIDPELQAKVDSYMEVNNSQTITPDVTPTINLADTIDDVAGSAPLLPTDELPNEVKKPAKKAVKKKETKKIKIAHFNDEEAEASADESVPESEVKLEAESVEESVVDPSEIVKEAEVKELEPEEVPEQPSEDIAETALAISDELEEDENDEENPLDSALIDTYKDPDELVAPGFEETDVTMEDTIAEAIEKSTKAEVSEGEAPEYDDVATAQAIDEIVAEDADELLAVKDAQLGTVVSSHKPSKSELKAAAKKQRSENWFKVWWKTPLYRNLTFLVLFLLAVVVIAMPGSRYFVLNTAGVRVSSSVKVLDQKTDQPLKNAELIIGSKSVKTDINGDAKIENIKLGSQQLIIKKPGFAEVNKKVTLGWGSNPLGDHKLTPTGIQFSFKATDFLSDQPTSKTEVVFGESSAAFNEKGQAILTIPKIEGDEIEVEVIADNYRSEKVKVPGDKKDETAVKLVPARKHAYVSKRTGKFDLYQSYVDGQGEELVQAGTGLEREESLGLAMHPTKSLVAFSSTSESVRNQDGYLLSVLRVIDLNTKQVFRVAQSERIQLVDWIGDRLIYVKITQGASEANLSRHKIMSYDVNDHNEIELASTNYFNDVVSAGGAIYYSPSQYKINGSVGLFRIDADGKNKQTIYDQEVWNIFRVSYDKLNVSVGQEWYELNLSDNKMNKIGGAPSSLKSRVYIGSPNKKHNLWIDERDGQSVLVDHTTDDNKDTVLLTQNGIKNPIYWLDDDHIIYRVADGRETADYVISPKGGRAQKISDVTNTVGVDRWYYF